MIHKKIPLSCEAYPEKNDVYLETYVSTVEGYYPRPAVLIIPGGGYECVCWYSEGEPAAACFMAHGYNAFVLCYSVGKSRTYPAQLCEASLAIAHIKSHAKEYNIDPDRVFVAGFSSGGHVSGSLGLFWHRHEVY